MLAFIPETTKTPRGIRGLSLRRMIVLFLTSPGPIF